jgi:hypothetical protein
MKSNFGVVIEVGIVRETEKAMLVNFRRSGYWVQKWLPKSKVTVLEMGERPSLVQEYSNFRTDCYGRVLDCKVKTTRINMSCRMVIPKWLYTEMGMTYGM